MRSIVIILSLIVFAIFSHAEGVVFKFISSDGISRIETIKTPKDSETKDELAKELYIKSGLELQIKDTPETIMLGINKEK